MKKRIVAMAIVAAMVTGCASGTGTDEVNEQSSSAVQSTEAVSEEAVEESTEEVTDGASDEASNEASEGASAEASKGASDGASVEASKEADKDAAASEASAVAAAKEEAAKEEAAKNEAAESAEKKEASASAGLEDGSYTTDLVTEKTYSPGYVKSITFTDDAIIIEGNFYRYDANWNPVEFGFNKYTFKTNASTQYLSSGGEQDSIQMSRDEYSTYLPGSLGSGLGLTIKLKGGYLESIDIIS